MRSLIPHFAAESASRAWRMSRKRAAPMLWSSEVYDYEKKVITDVAVGGIDLRKGAWIHCKWCNSTLKIATCFSLTSWKSHQRGKAHLNHEQEFLLSGSQPQFITKSSQSSVRSAGSDFQDAHSAVVTSQLSQDHESLMVVRRDLHLNKQHQARYQRDVSSVINAMTSLITDQQSDLHTLQRKVSDMTREILELQKEVERLRHQENLKKTVQAPPTKVTTTVSCTSQRKPTVRKFSVKVQDHRNSRRDHMLNHKKSKDTTMTDMDIFEKRFQLG